MRTMLGAACGCVLLAVLGGVAAAQEEAKKEYEVHDMSRPQPPVVTPGEPSTAEKAAPSDAKVLFDGKDLSQWKAERGQWNVVDGAIEVKPGTGSLVSNEQFGDVQLHIEWMSPAEVKGNSQGRGNSGVFLMGLFELQVLDVYDNNTYPDGMAGAMYGQHPPLVNAARKPGQWQTYDVVFRKPKTDAEGNVIKPATATVFWNGVLVQDHSKLLGPTKHKALATYDRKIPEKGPITLQDHGNPTRFRNIWVRELPAEKPAPPVRAAGAGR